MLITTSTSSSTSSNRRNRNGCHGKVLVLLCGLFVVTKGEDHLLNETLVSVPCPSTVTVFTALTEMVLEGRNDLLSAGERAVLSEQFRNIYNGLTTSNCDSYFRRLSNLTMINMTNPEGDMVDHSGESRRQLQATEAPLDLNASESRPGINVVYEVTGTCRDCEVTQAGSFELYDEAFRRNLKGGVRLRLLQVTSVTTERELENEDENDCTCVEGTLPEQPQAPGVQECVDAMNVAFMAYRMEEGLFQNLNMSDLIQLDDLTGSDIQVNGTFAPTSEVEVSRDEDSDYNVWGREGDNNISKDNTMDGHEFSATSTVQTHIGGSAGTATIHSSLYLVSILAMISVWASTYDLQVGN
jgi:hypothetical protein